MALLIQNRIFSTLALIGALQFVGARATEATDMAAMGAASLSDTQLAKLQSTDGKAAELGKDNKKLLYFWATW